MDLIRVAVLVPNGVPTKSMISWGVKKHKRGN